MQHYICLSALPDTENTGSVKIRTRSGSRSLEGNQRLNLEARALKCRMSNEDRRPFWFGRQTKQDGGYKCHTCRIPRRAILKIRWVVELGRRFHFLEDFD